MFLLTDARRRLARPSRVRLAFVLSSLGLLLLGAVLLASAPAAAQEARTEASEAAAPSVASIAAARQQARAHLAAGDSLAAVAAWHDVLAAAPDPFAADLDAAPPAVLVRLAHDALSVALRVTAPDDDNGLPGHDGALAETTRAVVTRAYGYVLAAARPDLPPDVQALAVRPLAQLAPLLAPALRDSVLAGPWAEAPAEATRERFVSDAGAALLRWWRLRDATPLTPQNERLLEHLRRTVEAEARYGHSERVTGYDDRGEIFVRLGPPDLTIEVTVGNSGALVSNSGIEIPDVLEVVRFTPGVSLQTAVEPNEVWAYPSISDAADYIFVRGGEGYERARPEQLLNPQLRRPQGRAAPSVNGSPAVQDNHNALAFQVMLQVYRQLARLDPAYGQLESSLYRWLDRLRPLALPVFLSQTMTETRIAGQEARAREAKRVPRQVGSETRRAAPFALALRTARFLDADGTTRLEAYWAPEPGALAVDPEAVRHAATYGATPGINILRPRYHLQAGLRLLDAQGQTRSLDVMQVPVPPAAAQPGATVPAQTHVLVGLGADLGAGHVALQADQHLMPARPAEGASASSDEALGPLVQRTVVRLDRLRALPSDPGRLLLSDLRPMLAPPSLLAQVRDPATAYNLAYPYPKLLPDAPLALYFEVYHLTFDPSTEQTRYRVTYEVMQETERGGLRRLLGPDADREATTTEVVQQGRSRRAEELITFDLQALALDGGSRLLVEVVVIDEVSGQTARRTVAFDVLDPATLADS